MLLKMHYYFFKHLKKIVRNLIDFEKNSLIIHHYYRHYRFDGERMQYIGMSKQ